MSKLDNLMGNPGEINGDDILNKIPSAINRRHFLRLLAIAAAGANVRCGNGGSKNDPSPQPPPDPVYENTLGLYDNFDGQGGHQDYDDSELAVAGQLSSQLWRGNFPLVDNPSGIVISCGGRL